MDLKCKFDHIGLLVWDREATVKALKMLPDAGEFTFIDSMNFNKDCVQVGEPFTIKGANGVVGGVEYEVIEVVPQESKGSYMMNRLEKYGEGLHHIAYHYDDFSAFEEMAERLIGAGYTVGHKAVIPFMGKMAHVYYLDAPDGGLTYEIKYFG
jgi:catechol 2,3-dioxygenase-like lactoylglutathione lyase family enzyme